MKRHENQPFNPTGSVSVPLFNQKKRNRVPLTSAPPVNEPYGLNEPYGHNEPYGLNESYGLNEYMTNASAAPSFSKAPGGYESYRPPESRTSAPESIQQYGNNRPAPRATPTVRQYVPLAHPYKAGNESSKIVQTITSMRQKVPEPNINPRFNKYQLLQNNSTAQSSHTGFSQIVQQPSYKPPNATYQFSEQSQHQHPPSQAATRPTPAGQQQSKGWNFTSSFGPQSLVFEGKKSTKPTTAKFQVKTQPAFQMKPVEKSLRILTAVIDGMRHWSQFKDKVPYLFEIFATLDSAVTLGPYGAKNFLIRDGKEVANCVYYENEQELPHLIRGQVHRCVGNYDRSRKVLVCVSIRAALPSELRNAQEAVKVCDAEMRALVKSFIEV